MQGFNMGRYVPPEHEGTTSGNALHRKRPPGISSSGVQTVRFELPFAIWCTTCKPDAIIGQGVRFNAVKTRVGAYYSTPIYAFRFRHPPCGGEIEIRTDPANTAYVVTSGAKKRDYGPEDDAYSGAAKGPGNEILTAGERAAARESAFSKLEKTIADREVVARSALRVEELAEVSERQGADPYAVNRALRADFRKGRKERERAAEEDEGLKGRLGLGGMEMDILPETEGDRRRAALVDFGRTGGEGDGAVEKVLAKPLFSAVTPAKLGIAGLEKHDHRDQRKDAAQRVPGTKAARLKAKTKDQLVSDIMGSARAAKDPFLEGWSREQVPIPAPLPGLKRKRAANGSDEPSTRQAPQKTEGAPKSALVDYDSDSE